MALQAPHATSDKANNPEQLQPRLAVPKAILFDADGTLIDSLPPHVDFCHAMNGKYCNGKLLIPPRDEGRSIHASPMDNFLLRAGFAKEMLPQLVQEYEISFGKHHKVYPFPLAFEMLKALKKHAPGTIIGIVSSNVRDNIIQSFKFAGIDDISKFLDVFVGLDNAPSRDKGETLKMLLRDLSIHGADTIYVGDTIKDYRHSHEVNEMNFVGVSYGFDDLMEAHLKQATIVTSPQHLMTHLLQVLSANKGAIGQAGTPSHTIEDKKAPDISYLNEDAELIS